MMIKMHIPQIIMIVLFGLNLGIALAKHGKPKSEEKYNFFASLIAVALEIIILKLGGFF